MSTSHEVTHSIQHGLQLGFICTERGQAQENLNIHECHTQGRLKIPEAPGLQHYGRPPYPRKLFLTIICQISIIFFLLICQLTFTTLFCVKCEYKWICKFTLCHKVALEQQNVAVITLLHALYGGNMKRKWHQNFPGWNVSLQVWFKHHKITQNIHYSSSVERNITHVGINVDCLVIPNCIFILKHAVLTFN